MPTTRKSDVPSKPADSQVPLSISLSEFSDLKAKVAAFETQVAALQTKIQEKDTLIERLQHDLDRVQTAEGLAYRKSRGYE